LGIAIWERIATYGVTPERYGIVIVALWLALVTLYLVIRRNRADMRALLGSFALLVLLGSVGPWGVNSVSIASQFARLEGFLASEKLLTPDRRITDPLPQISDRGKREIYSILTALNQMGGLDKVKPFFAGRKGDPFATGEAGWTIVSNISTALKLNEHSLPPDQVSFTVSAPVTHDITGKGRLIGPVMAVPRLGQPVEPDRVGWIEPQALIIRDGERQWPVPVKPLLERLKAVPPSSSQQPLVYDVESGVRLIVTEAHGNLGEPSALHRMVFWIILQQ
jgi:hypothetical protein